MSLLRYVFLFGIFFKSLLNASSYTCTSCSEVLRTSIHWASVTETLSPKIFFWIPKLGSLNSVTSAQQSIWLGVSRTCLTSVRDIIARPNSSLERLTILRKLVSFFSTPQSLAYYINIIILIKFSITLKDGLCKSVPTPSSSPVNKRTTLRGLHNHCILYIFKICII